jgi:glycolate oxidase iron-sulfur subunit
VQISKHLGLQGKTIPVLHPMQLLDLSIQGKALTSTAAGFD